MTPNNERPNRTDNFENDDPQARKLADLAVEILKLLGSRVGLAILGLAVLVAIIYLASTSGGFMKSGELEKETDKLKAEIEALEDDNRLLRQKIERLQTDQGYVEDEARNKLGLIRPGETVYRLSEEPDLSDGLPQPPLPGPTPEEPPSQP